MKFVFIILFTYLSLLTALNWCKVLLEHSTHRDIKQTYIANNIAQKFPAPKDYLVENFIAKKSGSDNFIIARSITIPVVSHIATRQLNITELHKDYFGENHPETIRQKGIYYMTTSQYTLADTYLKQAYFLKSKQYGKNNVHTLQVASNLMVNYFSLRQYSKALTLGKRTYSQMKRLLGSNHPCTMTIRKNLITLINFLKATKHFSPQERTILSLLQKQQVQQKIEEYQLLDDNYDDVDDQEDGDEEKDDDDDNNNSIYLSTHLSTTPSYMTNRELFEL